MSQENVEIVRTLLEGVRDGATMSGPLTLYDPDIEWDASMTEERQLGRRGRVPRPRRREGAIGETG